MKNEIYLISLKDAKARRDRLKERFKSFDEFKLIGGIDGRIMNAKEYFSLSLASFKAYAKLLSPAEIGCALSHMKAYEEFLKSDAKFALIFEDDVIGDDEGIKKAFELAENICENSVFICGCQDGLEGRFSAFGKRIKDELYLVSKHSHASIYRAAAYILTKSSAKALLQTHLKAVCVTDFWSYLLKKNQLKMYFSDIFSHPLDLGDSLIQGARDERGYERVRFQAYLNSFKYVLATRIEAKFGGYERIFKGKSKQL